MKFLRIAAMAFLMTATAQAAVQEAPFDDMDRLIETADVIIRGHVQGIRQDLRTTTIRIGVDQVFKGDVPEAAIRIRHRGGKHTVVADEPSFQSYDQAILYLVRGDQGTYRCLNGSYGKKTILNNNVYLHPDNNFISMRVQKYTDELTRRLELKYPPIKEEEAT